MKSNNVTTSGVVKVPQPPKRSPAAKYGRGDDVNAQTPGSNSITTNFPGVIAPNKPNQGHPGSENNGNTALGYGQGATGFNPTVSDATVSSDGRRRVTQLAVPAGDPVIDGDTGGLASGMSGTAGD